jgi:hypothetical protein
MNLLPELVFLRNSFSRNSSLTYALVFGLAIRLVLAPFLGHPYDLRIFMAVGWAVANGMTPYGQYVLQDIFTGILHPHLYGLFYGIGYPPTWGLIAGGSYWLYDITSPQNIEAYSLALKIPIIIGDLVTAFVLYRILRTHTSEETASKVLRFYLLCPFMIIVGAAWGMFDVLVFLFSIISTHLLYKRSNISALSLALASSLKPYAIILAPLYSIFIYRKTKSLGTGGKYLLLTLVALGVLTVLPMLVFGWSFSNLYYAMVSQFQPTDFYYGEGVQYTYGAASPFNIYNVLKLLSAEIRPPGILNYVWIPACLAVYLYAYRRETETDFKALVFNSFLVSLVFFTTRFWVSEQNLLFLLSFFMLTVLLNGTRKPWALIHGVWILLFAFVMIHVPAPSFLWMVEPWIFNAATAFCAGPYGYVRFILMTALTFSWLGLLWRSSIKEWIKW